MPIDLRALIEVIEELCKKENLKIVAKESLKGAIIAGAATLLGGLIGGRNGLLVGGAVGAGCAAAAANQFESAAVVIHRMSYKEKQSLYEKVRNALQSFTFEDAVGLSMLLLNNISAKQIALQVVTSFLKENGYNLPISH